MRKIWGTTVTGLMIFMLIFSVSAAKAGGSYETKVVVYNKFSTKMWVNFKCYDEKPWEDNNCLYFNTGFSELIKPGDSKEWSQTMKNTTAKCNKINISYGRYDRSCSHPACQKSGDFTFSEMSIGPQGIIKVTAPLILTIVNQGGDFVMQKGY